MVKEFNRKIVLEDGSEYYGYAFGDVADTVTEIVFNTSMAGYQEIISDPAYTYQSVVMTYPLIGNYGVTDDDFEAKNLSLGGLIVREYNDFPSNFRYTKTLSEVMIENHIPGIYGLDTRALTRSIRDKGTRKVLITDATTPKDEALKILKSYRFPEDAVKKVSCKKRWYSRTANPKFNVVAVDLGIKSSTIKALNKKKCNVTVVPYDTPFEEIIKMQPDGVFLSTGPGNPNETKEVINLVKELKGKCPIFGTGLGYQIMAIAYGAKTEKLKFGHRGSNHAVKNVITGKVEIVTQNHSYTVSESSLKDTDLEITHKNVLDGTIEGLEAKKDLAFGVEYQPELGNGIITECLYEKFIKNMEEGKKNA